MTESGAKHVFISYVREDAADVDHLCRVLEAARIPYWRDRASLGPGDAWRSRIKHAIRSGALVFLACFSDQSRAKSKSYMNEELTLAIEEFRQMPPGRTWLIPVRFDSGSLPDWDLGAGRSLDDLNYSDLFGPGHVANVAQLVTVINRLQGERRPGLASAIAAVEQVTEANRPQLLQHLTKEMLLDPIRRIELDELISQEVRRVLTALQDDSRVTTLAGSTENERIVNLAQEAQGLWELVKPFCASLQVAARWGSTDALGPWSNGIKSFVAAANRLTAGNEALLNLRHIPGLFSVMTAALACVGSGNWPNMKALVVDPTVRDRYQRGLLPILDATDAYRPFTSEQVANTVARASIEQKSMTESLEDLTQRRFGGYTTAVSTWLHDAIYVIFETQFANRDDYDEAFDRTEIFLGLLSQDSANAQNLADPDGRMWRGSRWFGRSTWRAARSYTNPVEEIGREFATQGLTWPPLRADLFGADENRAESAIKTYGEAFAKAMERRW